MLLVKEVQIFDGRQAWQGLYDVAVKHGVIHSIQPHDPTATAGEVVEGGGGWLLPGLIDLHVHLSWNGGPDPGTDIAHASPEQNLLETVANTLKYLAQGVTSVRDLGSPQDASLHVGAATASGQITGPRIFSSGMSLIMTGGHDPFHGLAVDGPYEALKGVRCQVAKGATVIKISATGGIYGRETGEGVDDTELRMEELEMIIDEAHRRNLPVTAHAIGEQGIRDCLTAGIDCIEHGHCIQPDMARQMAAQGTALVPTFYIYQHIAGSADVPAYAQKKAGEIIRKHRAALGYAKEAGVLIGAGSDAGSPQTPHPMLLAELLALEEGGLSRAEVLATATANAGEILGRKGQLGLVAEGALADLILVRDNPLEDLRALQDPACVILHGQVVKGKATS